MFLGHERENLQIWRQQQDKLALDLQKTQQMLRETQHKLSFLVEHNSSAIIQWNAAFEVEEWSPAAEKIFGYSKQDVLNRNVIDLIVPASTREHVNQIMTKLLKQEGSIRSSHENLRKDGTVIICDWYNTPLIDFQGNFIGVLSIVEDITSHKNTEAALICSEASFNKLTANVSTTLKKQAEMALQKSLKELADIKFALDQSSIVAITNNQGIIEYINDKFTQISQYSAEELIGKTHKIINSGHHDKEFFQDIWKTISKGKVWKGEIKNRAKDGTYYWVDTTIVPLLYTQDKPQQYVAIRNDITPRKQAEAELTKQKKELEQTLKELKSTQLQLIQSEKMSSLGQLVAGVAHEINNPVNFIYGNLQHADQYTQNLLKIIDLYQTHYPEPVLEIQNEATELDLEFLLEDLPKLYSSMTIGATRIREIVASLRTFSRLDEAALKATDIHEGIDSTLMILEHRLKSKLDRPSITVIKEYGNLPLVECYAGQLNQVFMNILVNAIDALEENNQQRKPTIHIKTQMTPPNQVIIRIKDNGMGISEEVLQKLFEPFYTTKPVGKGTGLGLSISYQVITDRHGGSLQCVSSPGNGAEFIIKIPIQQKKI